MFILLVAEEIAELPFTPGHEMVGEVRYGRICYSTY